MEKKSIPKFSIIVSVYNVADFIRETIESILSQTFTDFELVIVNDGSTDNSLDVIEDITDPLKRIKVLTKENGGLSSTRNYGLDHAQGEYVIFIDGDDYIENSTLEKCSNYFMHHDVDMIFWGYDSVTENGRQIKNGISKHYEAHSTTNDIVLHELANNKLNNYTWSFVTKRVVLQKIPKPIFTEGIFFEDVASTFRIVKTAQKISFLNQTLYHYVQRNGSITKTPSLRQFKDLQLIKDMIVQQLSDVISDNDLTAWKFYIDIASLQILSYHPLKNKSRLKSVRMQIIANVPENITTVTKVKTALISLKFYQYFYPSAARLRWFG